MFTGRLRVANAVLVTTVAAFVASGVSYAAGPHLSPLNAGVCKAIGGGWAPKTCTIDEYTSGVASSGIKINKGDSLVINGSLTIPIGVTIDNDGTIIVANVAGVPTTPFDDLDWMAGLLVLGTLDNSGAITIRNQNPNTEGITILVTVTQTDPFDLNTIVVVPGALTNSGRITIQNHGDKTRGIKNLGTLGNSAHGVISVANSDTTSVGIYNRRDNALDPKYYISGAMTNAGDLTISNSGSDKGFGIYNVALFTNSAAGTFTIDPGSSDAQGFYNAGNFTNYGTLVNNRGTELTLWSGKQVGSWNNAGTMVNYGTTYAGSATYPGTGTFLNYEYDGTFPPPTVRGSVMINLGKIVSYGIFADLSEVLTMINYGTFYNYGLIGGGTNKGICIDEASGAGGC